jgi:hypothetical protein
LTKRLEHVDAVQLAIRARDVKGAVAKAVCGAQQRRAEVRVAGSEQVAGDACIALATCNVQGRVTIM